MANRFRIPICLALKGSESAPAPNAVWKRMMDPLRNEPWFILPNIRDSIERVWGWGLQVEDNKTSFLSSLPENEDAAD